MDSFANTFTNALNNQGQISYPNKAEKSPSASGKYPNLRQPATAKHKKAVMEFDYGRDPTTKVTKEFNAEMLELRKQEEELLALQQMLDAKQK